MQTVPEQIRQEGWRQGDIIEGVSVRLLLDASIDFIDHASCEQDILLLICQDCDLVSPNLEKEPYVEFLRGRFVLSCSKDFLYGKNPRIIHLAAGTRTIEFSVHNRFRVKKEHLCKPEVKKTGIVLDTTGKRQVLDWLAKRYTRSAFSDTFNQRLSWLQKEQDALAKSELSQKVLIVLFDVTTDEYPPDQAYELQILIGVVEGTSGNDLEKIERAYEAVFSAPGIKVTDIAVRDELDITIRGLRTFKRWDRDYRSYPEAPDVALLPPGFVSL